MADYTRQSTINPGDPVFASTFNNEFDAIVNAVATKVDETDIGVTVQPFDADIAKTDVAQTWTETQTFKSAVYVDGSTTASTSFYNGGVRKGYTGKGSSGNEDIYLGADIGGIRLVPAAGNNITLSNSPRLIGLGNGTASTDAVNKGQLDLKLDASIYEVGVFTPTIDPTSTSSFVPTYSAQAGRYTKIGRIVHVDVYIVMASFTGSFGQVRIGGLPFGRNGDTVSRATMSFAFWGGLDLGAGYTHLVGFMQDTGNTVRLTKHGQTSGSGAVNSANITGGLTLYGSLTYEVG